MPNCTPDLARPRWKCLLQEIGDRQQPRSVCVRIPEGHHQPDWLCRSCRQLRTLQLGSPQLCLRVDEKPLHLDVQHLYRRCEHQVRCSQIAGRNRPFYLSGPAWVRGPRNRLDDVELTRVTKADAGYRVQAPTQLVTRCCREAASDFQRNINLAAFGVTHDLLADACRNRELLLGHAARHPSKAQFLATAPRQEYRALSASD